jgi:hypothetical protein
MKQVRPFIYAMLSSIAFILLMFVFASVMEHQANVWMEQDRVIPLAGRILFDVAVVWSKFWLVFVPFIFGLPMFAALVFVVVRRGN